MAAEIQSQEIPEEGEIVIATVRQITSHGVYVSLDEYLNMRGFLHISEIATGWVRHIERFVRVDQKVVLKVTRVNQLRMQVDLSLRQVSREQKKEKLIDVKRSEKAEAILELVKTRLNLPPEEVARLSETIMNEFDTLYDGLEQLVLKGPKAFQKLNLSAQYLEALQTASTEKIAIPRVEVSGMMEITNPRPDGVEVIRSALVAAEGIKTGGVQVSITYAGSPRYRIVVSAENYKVAEKALEQALQKVRETVSSKGGTFNFVRTESRKSSGG